VFHYFFDATLVLSLVRAAEPVSGKTGWLGIFKIERIAAALIAALRPLVSRLSFWG